MAVLFEEHCADSNKIMLLVDDEKILLYSYSTMFSYYYAVVNYALLQIATINGERFAGLNFHSFQKYHKSFCEYLCYTSFV